MADVKTEKQKVQEITDRLEEGLKELFESEKYKTYLSTMSKFHNYSFNNTLLIAMQKPDATLVAGYRAWQKNFERHVNKGEKAIRILAPAPYKIKEERDKLDPVTGELVFDENGMSQKEEVEIKIPAFRVVSVFDVSQTDGKPIPELEAEELLSAVEGYEDFVQAVMNTAPVPIGFEDIPGDSKGYFHIEEKRIAIQENMSESQILKTMLHETAHSMLHSREVSQGADAPAKDRNTKEVEAESIAYTVCQHFGIDTSDYSFGYIAGWSSGKDMKELKASLDTIRRTASELITGIEGQLKELQRDREIMQDMSINGLEKESLLLVQNSDLSEYSLLNVRGMDAAEIVEALSAMNDDDRLSVAAYLESKGAWTTEIANEETREFGEYHLDVRYNTDTNEITDLKTEMEWNERAKEPIGADDVILKITHLDGFEVERITNKTPQEVQEIMGALTKLEALDRKNIRDCLESYGADYIPIIVSGGRNSGMPQFNDFEIDLNKKEVAMMSHLSPAKQAEGIINRLEFSKTVFSDEERNLIVNYAYKLNDMEKTRELAEHIYYEETEGNQGAALAVIDAQAEIDALPDPMIGLSEMEEYGYTWEEMLPLTQERALELFDRDLPVYLLHEDGSEMMAENRVQLMGHEGIFGIEKADWENERNLRTMQEELAENEAAKETQLLYGSTDKYGIYQLKDSPELRAFQFAGTEELKRMGITKDNFEAIQRENYSLIYVGELSEMQGQTQGAVLEAVYEKFNIDHPADYMGHSLSVSDIVVLHQDGKNTAHFVDSFGFTTLPEFLKEQVQELEAVQEEMQDTSGHNVQKPEPEKMQTEQSEPEQEEQSEQERTQPDKTPELEDMDDGDEIIDLGDEKEQVLAEMKKSLTEDKETELAFQIADRYITIQEVEGGYDYSIMGADYKEIDGGVYDNPDVGIREALHDIVEDLKSEPDYNGAKGRIGEDDELIPIDYDGLMEKVEAANRIQPQNIQSSVVADFKAKTDELFHDISEMNPSEIEETVKIHVQAKIDEYGIDAQIVDVAVAGSRCRGLEREGSDLDVVVELSTKEREDDLFNAFNNSDGIYIGGIKVDINPITAQRTGSLENYLPQVEKYLEGVREAREKEPISIFNIRMNDEERWFKNTSGLDAEGLCKAYAECDKPFVEMGKYGEQIEAADHAYIEQGDRLDFSIEFNEETDRITIFDGENFEHKGLRATLFPEQAEPEVTLIVAECGEFHNMGEFYENIPTVDEAVAIWKQIPPERMNGIPAIGINIHTPGTEEFEDVGIDILSGKRIDLDILEYIPDIKGNPQAMEVIAELVAKAMPLMPEMEIDGSMSEEMEAKVWDYRTDLTQEERLAVEIDRFIYSYDMCQYRDSAPNMTENVSELAECIKQGDIVPITEWLANVIDEVAEPEETKKAKELLEKLAEYKPLAKIEEMEEQNYNMVDNVLNNGAGEKAQKEAAKKEQEQPAARGSLKARLAEKKAQATRCSQDHDAQENIKKNQREM